MAATLQTAAAARQSAPVDRRDPRRSASADLEEWLALMNRAVAETGWTPEALDAHWNTSRGYAWRLLNGEKSWSVERLLALPDDIESRFEALRAESFGHIVVAPLAREEGMKAFVAGLCSLLGTPALPAKAGAPAKADLAPLAMKGIA